MSFSNFKKNPKDETFSVVINGKSMTLGTQNGQLKSGGPIIDLSDEMKDLLNDNIQLALELFSAASAHFNKNGVKLNIA